MIGKKNSKEMTIIKDTEVIRKERKEQQCRNSVQHYNQDEESE